LIWVEELAFAISAMNADRAGRLNRCHVEICARRNSAPNGSSNRLTSAYRCVGVRRYRFKACRPGGPSPAAEHRPRDSPQGGRTIS